MKKRVYGFWKSKWCLCVGFEKVVGRQALDHLKDQLPHLLDVKLRNKVGRTLLNSARRWENKKEEGTARWQELMTRVGENSLLLSGLQESRPALSCDLKDPKAENLTRSLTVGIGKKQCPCVLRVEGLNPRYTDKLTNFKWSWKPTMRTP